MEGRTDDCSSITAVCLCWCNTMFCGKDLFMLFESWCLMARRLERNRLDDLLGGLLLIIIQVFDFTTEMLHSEGSA